MSLKFKDIRIIFVSLEGMSDEGQILLEKKTCKKTIKDYIQMLHQIRLY